jgi:hypothetical protein
VAAADVCHRRTAFELGDNSVERREPAGDELGVAAGPEPPLAAIEDVPGVLVPPDALTRFTASVIRGVDYRAERDLEQARQVGGLDSTAISAACSPTPNTS